MLNNLLKTVSIFAFAGTFLLGSVASPFFGSVGADTPIDFIKQVKQEGQSTYVQNLSVTDTTKPLIFRIYVHNPTTTTYTNGLLRDEFPFDQTGNIKNRALLNSDQTPLLYSEAFINLPSGKKINYRANSSRVYGFNDSVGTAIPDVNGQSPLITPQGLKINKILGGEDIHKHWYVFYADIVDVSTPTPKPAPSMEGKKEVRNVTQNSGYADSVSANAGDILEYRIWVHNKVVGSEATNVVVTDAFPTAEGQSFFNKATISGSNITPLTVTAIVNTAFVGRLEYIVGSTKTFVHADKSAGVAVADVNGKSALFGNGIALGGVKGCFEFERFVTFRAKVIKPEVLVTPPTELPDTGPTAGLIVLASTVPAGLILRKLKNSL
jgi:uncharacterized repeat protein (TIGR01451 family)